MTAVPVPAKTSQKVPIASARARRLMFIEDLQGLADDRRMGGRTMRGRGGAPRRQLALPRRRHWLDAAGGGEAAAAIAPRQGETGRQPMVEVTADEARKMLHVVPERRPDLHAEAERNVGRRRLDAVPADDALARRHDRTDRPGHAGVGVGTDAAAELLPAEHRGRAP